MKKATMSDSRELPTGRLGRFARLAALGAKTSVSLLASRDGRVAAAQAAEVLGQLRGLAAKVGQMASYVDGMVPPAQRAAYESALATLRAASPTSSPEAIQALVETELGAPIDRLFAEWETEPCASASIGQVHRARLFDGREVAVKVQHPGIDRAVESDLQNASVLEGVFGRLLPRGVRAQHVFDDIRARFREELDYRLEAEQQCAFAELHSGDAHIRIPGVVAERSARRVLCSEFVRGSTLEVAAQQSEAERRAFAETLWRFVFKGTLVGGRFNADPHPGNFLFHERGQITFLDFGCVQMLDDTRRKNARALHAAAIARDDRRFREAAVRLLESRGGTYEDKAVAYTRRCFEPLFASPFTCTSEYVSGVVQGIGELKREMFAKDRSFVMPPPGMAFMNRLQFGFYSVLARLHVEVDYAAVERRFLGESGSNGVSLGA
jgi:predicted unusual protein kinase regulating ubiquinone biosynthesis (AarF/ABC1/UbiB family)